MRKDRKVFGWVDLPDKPHVRMHPFTLDSRTAVIPHSWKHELSPTIGATASDPWLQRFYDQRDTPMCVAFAWARVMSWWNCKRYDAPDFYSHCLIYDGLPIETIGTTNYGAGRAAYHEGLRAFYRKRGIWQKESNADKANGIVSWQWATSIEDCIAYGKPFPIGTKWYRGMMNTFERNGKYWVDSLGQLEGGHDWSVWEINLEERFIGGCNNWGTWFSHNDLFYMSFDLFEYLLEGSECCLIVDRPGGDTHDSLVRSLHPS